MGSDDQLRCDKRDCGREVAYREAHSWRYFCRWHAGFYAVSTILVPIEAAA